MHLIRDPAPRRLSTHTPETGGRVCNLYSVASVQTDERSNRISCASGMPRVIRAMTEYGVRRLVFTSGFGVGETFRDVPLGPRLFVRTLLRDVYRVGVRLPLRGFPTISRADVAHFLLSQVADRSFIHQGVLLSS